jgi:Fe-S cluster assembly protein SufD
MTTTSTPEHGTPSTALDAVDESFVRSVAGDEPTWLVDRRLAATKRFTDQAWPDSRADEFWRSTPFSRRIDVQVPVAVGSDADAPGSLVDSLDLRSSRPPSSTVA